MKKITAYTLLATASLMTVSLAKWSRISGGDKRPTNMSLLIAGTSVDSSKGVNPSGGLILGDPTRAITIAGGKSEAVLKLAAQSYIEKASFVSDGLEGKVSASISSDGKAWNAPASTVFSPADRNIMLDLGRAQGRYLRLEFELVRGGTIRSFQAFGAHDSGEYTVTQSPDNSGPSVNLASGIGGGRLIYVNPELYGSRNDAIKYNQLEFPESDEKYRTAVYDLGQVRTLNEFGSVHSPRPVRFSVYAFEALPEKEDWRGRLAFDPTVFDTTEPVAYGEESSGSGSMKVKPKKLVKARYVALRWEPDFNPPSFNASGNISANGVISHSHGGANTNTTSNNGSTTATTTSSEGTTTTTVNPNSAQQTSSTTTSATNGNTGTGGTDTSNTGTSVINATNPTSSANGAGGNSASQ